MKRKTYILNPVKYILMCIFTLCLTPLKAEGNTICMDSVVSPFRGLGGPDTRIGTAQSTTKTAGMFGKGSEEKGQTLPAVLVPNGMNFWTPQTEDTEVKCRAPYYYKDERLQGFRASHWIVGGCTQDYGSVTLMPLALSIIKNEKLKIKNSNSKTILSRCLCPEERASKFCHEREVATPSYYSVHLDDYNIDAEMTGLSHSAIFRFTYPSDSTACLVVNPNSDEGEGFIEVLPFKHQIRGYNPAHRIYQGKGQPCGFSGWFIIQLPEDVEITEYGTYHCDSIFEGKTQQAKGVQIGAYVKTPQPPLGGDDTKESSASTPTHQLIVKVATSFVDWEGCEKNLLAEIPDWDFDKVRLQCAAAWQQQFSKITIENTETNLSCPPRGGERGAVGKYGDGIIFQTALYHASFLPREFSDVDGRYPSFGGGTRIMQMPKGHKYYEDYSMWDTYRALHPLLILLDTAKVADMMQSLVLKYEQGGWMPIFPCWNSYTAAMIGDHTASVFADACVKGIRGFDVKKAYEGLRKNAFESPSTFEEYKNGMGRRALKSYLQYGYIPLEDSVKEAYHKCEQVSRTMEYAYDDYCLAQLSLSLTAPLCPNGHLPQRGEKVTNGLSNTPNDGGRKDYAELMKRSKNYCNVINPQTHYADGRYANGSFFSSPLPARGRVGGEATFQKFITEGAPCHYTFYAPHDIPGLIKAMGGRKSFVNRLDSLFEQGRYWHGNEPCHQIAYLYDYVGQPEKTQHWVHHILTTEYNDTPGGLSGNDDAGQMSAWYIFSAMGFYPVCPGKPEYAIGMPLFPKVTLHLQNSKTFTITTSTDALEKSQIKTMRLNGKKLKQPFLTHNDIMNGGTLELK